MKLYSYLNFAGNTEAAFQFYQSVFGGEISSLVRFRDMKIEGSDVPEADQGKIMHISLPIGQADILMASDSLESMGQRLTVGNNVYLYVETDGKAEADRVFSALAAGGTVEMTMADMPWGDYFGSLQDRFGIWWMVSTPSQAPNAGQPIERS